MGHPILESGLVRETDGRYELVGPLPPLAIPATLHDSLLARLDRLAAEREVAQLAATIGREFAYDLLCASALAAGLDETALRDGLAKLVAAELIYQRGLPPRATYLFKHALVRDAAYESLVRRRRQQFHLLIAQTLAKHFPELDEQNPEIVAHHYTEAALAERALPYWRRAGERALSRSAYLEAEAHLHRAIAALAALPEGTARDGQELDLQIALGSALLASRGYGAPAVGDAFARAQELCLQGETTDKLFPVLYGRWAYCSVSGQFQVARSLAEDFLTLARREGHPAVAVAHRAVGLAMLHLGQLPAAAQHFASAAVSHDGRAQHDLVLHYGIDPGVGARAWQSWPLWLLGHLDQALVCSRESIERAQQGGHPYTLALGLYCAAAVSVWRQEPEAALAHARAGLALCAERGFALIEGWLRIVSGWALALGQDVAEGLAQVRRGLAAVDATGSHLHFSAYQLSVLAQVCGLAGEIHQGLAALDEALAIIDDTGERFWLPEVHRLRGALLLQEAPDDHARAEACFRQALVAAREQQAKSLELRAATSLARLWQRHGRRAEARAVLAPIYAWFTEGFDTPDLQEAKALLTELA